MQLATQARAPVVAMRASRKAVVVRAAQEPIKVGINGASVVRAGRVRAREKSSRKSRV
jgi:hypothetical protein